MGTYTSSSMPSFTLFYFNVRGRGEIARLLFKYADVPYTDHRLPFPPTGEEWPKLKPLSPFEQVPFLEVDGLKIGQSLSIARYLARKFDLMGGTVEDEAVVDMLVMSTSDAVEFVGKFFFGKGEKTELRDGMKDALARLEKELKTRGTKFAAPLHGDKVTLADLFLFYLCEQMVIMPQISGAGVKLADFPLLEAHYKFMSAKPRIKAWVEA